MTEIVTGNLPVLHLSTNCHCPPSHPVVLANSAFCERHPGIPASGSVDRINPLAHPVGYINDNSFARSWISATNEPKVNISMKLVDNDDLLYEVTLQRLIWL